MPSLARFLRATRRGDLLIHAERLGLDKAAADNQRDEDLVNWISSACSAPQREQLLVAIEKIAPMADEIGQAAMLSLPDWRNELLKIDGALARAHWLYLRSEQGFRHAEEVRYANENQNSQRMWTGFVGPAGHEIDLGADQLQKIEGVFKEALGVDRVHVELIERLPSTPDGHTQLQLTIYSEDMPVDELEFLDNATLRNRSRRPVRETAIVYDAGTGQIEVVSKRQELRHAFAKLFAEHCLGTTLSGETLPMLRLDLMPLIDAITFPTRDEDGISKVKLTMLTLSPSDQRLIQQFQVRFEDSATLHELLDAQYGDANPLEGDLYPWRARIEILFEPTKGRKRGKKINVELTKPNRCNIRGKTERERLILDGYLHAWGLRLSNAA